MGARSRRFESSHPDQIFTNLSGQQDSKRANADLREEEAVSPDGPADSERGEPTQARSVAP